MSLWDDEAGYDRDDPKHPDWADAMVDKADRMRDEMMLDGSMQRFKKWQDERFAAGLTGPALSLGEFRRQEAENEAEEIDWNKGRVTT